MPIKRTNKLNIVNTDIEIILNSMWKYVIMLIKMIKITAIISCNNDINVFINNKI